MNNQIQIPVNFYEEGNLIVATSPALEITTQGDTFENAKSNFDELLGIFFEEFNTRESLEKVLLECGWQKVENKLSPPREVARVYQSIAMPQFVI